MGRKRVIGQEAILDAAETVVLREGVVGLTLDAVAKEAGISKASVLYDYKSKDALVTAILERYLAVETAKMNEACNAFPADDKARNFKGRLNLMKESLHEKDRTVCTALSVAMARDQNLKTMMQDTIRKDYEDICKDAAHPQGALLAFLAMHGLLSLEYFDFMQWNDKERKNLIQLIEWVYHQSPALGGE